MIDRFKGWFAGEFDVVKVAKDIFSYFGSWIGLVATILSVTLFIWVFAVKAPFLLILCWVIFLIGVPILWNNKGQTFEFWVWICGKNALKVVGSLFLFLLIRAYFSHMLNFTPFESWMKFTETTGTTSIFGYTPNKVLFEATFMVLTGLMVITAVFGGKHANTARVSTGGFLLLCFLLQAFVFGNPQVADETKKAIKEERIVSNVQDHGGVGATAIAIKNALFGRSTAFATTSGPLKPGLHHYEMIPGDETAYIYFPSDRQHMYFFEDVESGTNFKRIYEDGVEKDMNETYITNKKFKIRAISKCKFKIRVT